MDEPLFFSLIDHFSDVEDPRIDRTKKHNVIDIISITIMATISGMQNWMEIVDWSETNQEWLKTFLELPGGIPSHDTFGRVFSLINPEAFQEAFKSWVESIKLNFPSREIIAIDGKFLNGSFVNNNSRSSLIMVSAWACKSGLSLGQPSSRLKKDEGEKRTMEKLIDQIDVRGNIITIDAGGATTTIIGKIAEKGGENEFAESVRSHWKIENNLHWQLDVTFREDFCRSRIGYASDNLAIIRRLALNLLKKDLSEKKSIRRKQLLCNWNKDYLLHVTMGI